MNTRYFAITECYNCLNLKSLYDSTGKRCDVFHTRAVKLRMSRILCAAHLPGTTHEQSIICRELFACHVAGSRPMKEKEKTHQMMTVVIKNPTTVIYENIFVSKKMYNYENFVFNQWNCIRKLTTNHCL